MRSSSLFTGLLVVLLLVAVCLKCFVRSESPQSCSTLPISRLRNCTVTNSTINPLFTYSPIKVHLTWYDFRCRGHKTVDAMECPAYLGMTLTFECDIQGTYVYNVRENRQMGSKALFSVLQPEHAGEYQCRRSSDDEVISAYNITVLSGMKGGGCACT